MEWVIISMVSSASVTKSTNVIRLLFASLTISLLLLLDITQELLMLKGLFISGALVVLESFSGQKR